MVKEFKLKFEPEKDALITASKVFYFAINGVYVKSTFDINKKIIQALGSAVFNSNYRFEIGLDSLTYDENGFAAKVERILDYGENEKYLECDVFGQKFYIKAKSGIGVGSEIKVSFNLQNIKIYENKFDIRLY